MAEARYAEALQRQRCKACWNTDGFDFSVPDKVWEAVVPAPLRDHVVCLRCFDDFAADRGIDYSGDLHTNLYFAGDAVSLVLRVEASSAAAPVHGGKAAQKGTG
jgi:hypothetical protein